jgi:hypothetical protein
MHEREGADRLVTELLGKHWSDCSVSIGSRDLLKSRLSGLAVRVPGYRSRGPVRFPTLPDFLTSSGSGRVSTQPRDYNRGAASKKKQRLPSRKPQIRP